MFSAQSPVPRARGPLHCRLEPYPLPPPSPNAGRAGWAGARGGWGRGKQAAELEQSPWRLSPRGLALRQTPGLVSGRWRPGMAPAL